MEGLIAALEELEQHRRQVSASGEIAPPEIWIDTYSPGGRNVYYARLRSDRPKWSGKKTKGLGRVGGEQHRDWEVRIQRRNTLTEIERRVLMIQAMLDYPLWEPE